MDTITNYEKTRVEFDAYRNQLEELQINPQKFNAMSSKTREMTFKMEQARSLYEKKRNDVCIKLELLDENRIKVMRQQLLLLHSATGIFVRIKIQKKKKKKFQKKIKLKQKIQKKVKEKIQPKKSKNRNKNSKKKSKKLQKKNQKKKSKKNLTKKSIKNHVFKNIFPVSYFNGSHEKVVATLKILEQYQSEQQSFEHTPSFLEIEQNGKQTFLIKK